MVADMLIQIGFASTYLDVVRILDSSHLKLNEIPLTDGAQKLNVQMGDVLKIGDVQYKMGLRYE